MVSWGLPRSSGGKESTCNAGDAGLTPGLGRSAGEGLGYPLQYSWASPVAQLAKNSPAMQETWVQSLGWEDPMKKEMTTHSSILAWKTPMDREAWWAVIHRVAKSQARQERLSTHACIFSLSPPSSSLGTWLCPDFLLSQGP